MVHVTAPFVARRRRTAPGVRSGHACRGLSASEGYPTTTSGSSRCTPYRLTARALARTWRRCSRTERKSRRIGARRCHLRRRGLRWVDGLRTPRCAVAPSGSRHDQDRPDVELLLCAAWLCPFATNGPGGRSSFLTHMSVSLALGVPLAWNSHGPYRPARPSTVMVTVA